MRKQVAPKLVQFSDQPNLEKKETIEDGIIEEKDNLIPMIPDPKDGARAFQKQVYPTNASYTFLWLLDKLAGKFGGKPASRSSLNSTLHPGLRKPFGIDLVWKSVYYLVSTYGEKSPIQFYDTYTSQIVMIKEGEVYPVSIVITDYGKEILQSLQVTPKMRGKRKRVDDINEVSNIISNISNISHVMQMDLEPVESDTSLDLSQEGSLDVSQDGNIVLDVDRIATQFYHIAQEIKHLRNENKELKVKITMIELRNGDSNENTIKVIDEKKEK